MVCLGREGAAWRDVRQAVLSYYACISFMDAQIGVLLDAMDKLGLWDNTVVVLWGDHGYQLGEHGGQWEKVKLWEESIRAPLILAAPGKAAGAASPRVVEFLDIYPTLVDLCGLPDPGGLQGASLSPLLAKPDAPWERAAFSVLGNEKTDTIRARSVRTERWHYVEYGEGGKDGAMLYDHASDPREYRNLANDPKHAATVAEMKRRLRHEQERIGVGTKTAPGGPRPVRAGREAMRTAPTPLFLSRCRALAETAACLLATLLTPLGGPAAQTPPADQARTAVRPPNLVVLLADDMGRGDLHCFGSPVIQTPNLDKLAGEGMKLNVCYAGGAVCSPSRAALMTGRVPGRLAVWNWIPAGSPMHVGRGEITVGKIARAAGYATAHVGKWHLNGVFNAPAQPQPGDHGFDHWFSTQNNANPTHKDPENFVRNGKPAGKLAGYSSALIADEAIGWLKTAGKGRPFCLFVWFHAPHQKIASAPEFVRMYGDKHPPQAAEYYANVTQLDHEIGRVLKQIDAMGARDDTLVFFSSDNGPANAGGSYGSAGGLSGRKGSLGEGGIREPGILRWPGRTRPGQVCNTPVAFVDLLPTVCALTGTPLPKDRALDGASFLPIFEGKSVERAVPLFWHQGKNIALRDGDWKIVGHAERNTFALYNLAGDPAEKTDLREKEPARYQALLARAKGRHAEVLAEGAKASAKNEAATTEPKQGGSR